MTKSKLYAGGDLSFRHGGIVRAYWDWNQDTKMPELKGIEKAFMWRKLKAERRCDINMRSTFNEIEWWSNQMVKDMTEQDWTEPPHEIIVCVEWDQNSINYRGTKKRATMVLAQAMILIDEYLPGGMIRYFVKPAIIGKFRGKDKITSIEDLDKNKNLLPMNWDYSENAAMFDKQGDFYDALLISMVGFLLEEGKLDEYLKIYKERQVEHDTEGIINPVR